MLDKIEGCSARCCWTIAGLWWRQGRDGVLTAISSAIVCRRPNKDLGLALTRLE
jgi:hypothetical protein